MTVKTYRFHVSLSKNVEVDFNQLVQNAKNSPQIGPSPPPKPAGRYNIIERLEQRYATGALVGNSPEKKVLKDEGKKKKVARKGMDEDDLYDSEDSFIDDSELEVTIEHEKEGKRHKTKYGGFFVNAGSRIDTVYESDEELDSQEDEVGPSAKKRIKSVGDTQRYIEQFIEEHAQAMEEWNPGDEVRGALEELRIEAEKVFKTTQPGKSFSRELDDHLRKVDRLVIKQHKKKWRLNAYFGTLMQYLPYTKGTLKASMTRLEARDAAREAEQALKDAEPAFRLQIEKRLSVLNEEEPFTFDKSCRDVLFTLVHSMEEWVAASNAYREILKPIDKKRLSPDEILPLNALQERNSLYQKIVSFFPPNRVDVNTLRSKYNQIRARYKSVLEQGDKESEKKGVSPAKVLVEAKQKPSPPVKPAAVNVPPKERPEPKFCPPKVHCFDACPQFKDSDFPANEMRKKKST